MASVSGRCHQLLPVGGSIMTVKKKVCAIGSITSSFRESSSNYPANLRLFTTKYAVDKLPKSEFCFSRVERLEMIIDRGIRPTPSKIEAIMQLSQPSKVEKARVLLGMESYLRTFVPKYSSVLNPISKPSFVTHAFPARRLGT